jgi:hypothetical protein
MPMRHELDAKYFAAGRTHGHLMKKESAAKLCKGKVMHSS